MASRRDLFQSYQFMVQRVIAGLVLRETDPEQMPLRRIGGAFFGSVMIGVLALAVAGIIGVISPGGNTTWRTADAVIIEEDTGARFVWLEGANGEFALHPVPNLSSGALIIGSTKTVEVSHNSLKETPRGPRLGIPGALDSIPPASSMLDGPWTLCSLPARTVSGERVPNTALVIGQSRTSGSTIGEQSVLVRDIETGLLHLVWNGRQFPITHEDAALEALSMRNVPHIEVGTAWLSALPAGDPIAPVAAPGAGAPSSAVPGGIVGEVRSVSTSGGVQHYLVLGSSLRALTPLQASVTLADPSLAQTAYAGRQVVAIDTTAAAAAAAPKEPVPDPQPTDAPAEVPEPAKVSSPTSTVCGSVSSAAAPIEIAVDAAVTGADLAPATPTRTEGGTVLVDRVLVTGGYGAVVRSKISPEDPGGALFLIGDDGVRYPVTEESLKALGLDSVTPVDMPAAIVARIPSGPALDRAAAIQPY